MVRAWTLKARAGESRSHGRLSLSDVLTLAAIALVVVVVSLPSLHRFALRENEADAAAMLVLIGDTGASPSGGEPPRLPDVLARSPALARRLEDCRDLGGGRLLRHGYLFERFEAEPGVWIVRAWPWRHAQTGVGAFVWCSAGLLRHPNREGRFSGPEAPPAWSTSRATDWTPVARP